MIYNSVSDIFSFEFSTSNGNILSVDGGDSAINNFFIDINSQTVLGTAIPDPIPAGCGTLLTLEFDENIHPDFLYDLQCLVVILQLSIYLSSIHQ